MSDDLKSCPFCGSYDLGSGGDDKVVGYWCKRCEATGPNHYGRYEWNSRADRIEELEAKLAQQDALVQAAVAAREAQKVYFKDRSRDNLIASKQAEAALDKMLAAIREGEE